MPSMADEDTFIPEPPILVDPLAGGESPDLALASPVPPLPPESLLTPLEAPENPPELVEPPARHVMPPLPERSEQAIGQVDQILAATAPPLKDVRIEAPRPPVHRLATAPLELPTPVHRFRVNSHEPISLDAPAIIGRAPTAPRITKGNLARLVRVPSPLREVSSTHLELRQHGGAVVVTDLKSTNGTLVIIPGTVPVKLRQGESIVVSAGTVVDIGDGNLVEILPVARVTALEPATSLPLPVPPNSPPSATAPRERPSL